MFNKIIKILLKGRTTLYLMMFSFISGMIITLIFNFFNFYNNSNYYYLLMIISFTSFLLIISVLFQIFIPRNYPVAVVGFPKSGKTTLITSLFSEIFIRKIKVKAIINSTSTIDRINANLKRIEMGKSLGPTKDQDVFAYRTKIRFGHFFPFTYNVEFGDFAGEESETLSDDDQIWFHNNSDFFKWIMQSNAIIFIIDLGQYLLDKKRYLASVSSAIRCAWQHFVNSKNEIESFPNLKKFPIILSFTKTDLIYRKFDSNIKKEEIKKIGFGENIPEIIEINEEESKKNNQRIINEFKSIITYLKSESNHFKFIFTSSFATLHDKRLGLEDILKSVFKKNI